MSAISLQGNAGGTGTLTIAAPNTASNYTLTLPAETGTLYSSTTPVRTQKGVPAFSANASANQNVTSATWTKVSLQTEVFDVTAAFDNVTNYRFQPTVAGYYQINATGRSDGTSVSAVAFAVYKNGSQDWLVFSSGSSITQATFSGAKAMYLNGSTDYVELWGQVTASSAARFDSTASSLSGFLISAA